MYQLFKMVLAFAGCQFAVLDGIFRAIMIAGHALKAVSVPFRTLLPMRRLLPVMTIPGRMFLILHRYIMDRT